MMKSVVRKLRSSGNVGFIELVDGKFRIIEGNYCEYPDIDSHGKLIILYPEKFGVGTLREAQKAMDGLMESGH